MIDLDPLIQDRESYRQVLGSERWIYNKLTLAERLGYYAAPCGINPRRTGDYIVRPIMNVAGNGIGGVFTVTVTQEDLDADADHMVPYLPGYFWCEKFTGVHAYTHFVDDAPVDECYGLHNGDEFDYEWRTDNYAITQLPQWLRLFSKHLLIETIDGNIIEASPRGLPYIHGRGTSRMVRVRIDLPWDFDVDNRRIEKAFYWRQIPK